MFCVYEHDDVIGGVDSSSVKFDNYGVFIQPMEKTMQGIYNWNDVSENEKKQIIYRRSRRLRFYTHSVKEDFLQNNIPKESNDKDPKPSDKFIFDDDEIEGIKEDDGKTVGIPFQVNEINTTKKLEDNRNFGEITDYLSNHLLPFPPSSKSKSKSKISSSSETKESLNSIYINYNYY